MTTLFRRILCPVDFDEASLSAVQYAAQCAGQSDAEVHLLHVVPTDEFHLHRAVYRPEQGGGANVDWAEHVAEENLKEIAQRHLSGVRSTVVTCRNSDQAEGILAMSKAIGADLVVMATHGRTGMAHLLRGSVTERVIRDAACPVLALRSAQGPAATQPLKKILVPIGADDRSLDVLTYVAQLAEQYCSTVYVLHAVPTEKVELRMSEVYGVADDEEPSLVKAEHATKVYLENVAREHLHDVAYETIVHVSEDPGRTILEVEQDIGADLLVMATHGLHGALHALVGSLTEKIVRASFCPVLALHSGVHVSRASIPGATAGQAAAL